MRLSFLFLVLSLLYESSGEEEISSTSFDEAWQKIDNFLKTQVLFDEVSEDLMIAYAKAIEQMNSRETSRANNDPYLIATTHIMSSIQHQDCSAEMYADINYVSSVVSQPELRNGPLSKYVDYFRHKHNATCFEELDSAYKGALTKLDVAKIEKVSRFFSKEFIFKFISLIGGDEVEKIGFNRFVAVKTRQIQLNQIDAEINPDGAKLALLVTSSWTHILPEPTSRIQDLQNDLIESCKDFSNILGPFYSNKNLAKYNYASVMVEHFSLNDFMINWARAKLCLSIYAEANSKNFVDALIAAFENF